jgi:hypothetical protein
MGIQGRLRLSPHRVCRLLPVARPSTRCCRLVDQRNAEAGVQRTSVLSPRLPDEMEDFQWTPGNILCSDHELPPDISSFPFVQVL